MNTFELLKPRPGLRVVVSGAASGIGAAIAEAFLQVDARVCICDVDPAAIEQARARHPGLHATLADVGDRAQVDRLFDEVSRHFGGLDLLVNNAGIAGRPAGSRPSPPRTGSAPSPPTSTASTPSCAAPCRC